MVTDLEFAQYISAKICHDLAGALGALSNGVEFIGSSDPMVNQKAKELINISATQAIETLKLFRQIYGASQSDFEADLVKIKQFAQMIVNGKNINLEFLIPNSLPTDRAFDVHIGKLMLAIICLAKSNLIYGGTIRVAIYKIGDRDGIKIIASGKDIKSRSEHSKIILGELDIQKITSSNIDAYYIKRLKEEIGCKVQINEDHNTIEYVIEYKS